ncbi:MAG: PPOX class F420-dependent oxidoreductase [Alphaproteobacteria bacterium]
MTDLTAEKYISLTTFTKDGRPKPTPVWFAPVDGKLNIVTDESTWKVKRLRNTPNVEVTPCNASGKVAEGAVSRSGTAELVPASDPRFPAIDNAIQAKYGLMAKLFRWFGKLRGNQQTGILVTLDTDGPQSSG